MTTVSDSRVALRLTWKPEIHDHEDATTAIMPYVITEPCIGVKDRSCVDVCPVDCIHGSDEDEQLYIEPEVCIDCGACVSACPVEAIYAEADVPAKWEPYVQINADYYKQSEKGRAVA